MLLLQLSPSPRLCSQTLAETSEDIATPDEPVESRSAGVILWQSERCCAARVQGRFMNSQQWRPGDSGDSDRCSQSAAAFVCTLLENLPAC